MATPVLITRRVTLLAGCIAVGSGRASAGSGATVAVETLDVDGAPLKVVRYSAEGARSRPAVVVLHGSKGLDAHFEAYDRYARDLCAVGVDALLLSYFRPQELAAINGAPNASVREAQYARSIDRWVSLVRTVAGSARNGQRSSGHVGILGFSLGGFVAVAAASEPMFSVLMVFYAGLPSFYDHPIHSLPPLLDIHGDADRSVPLSQGAALVAAAKRLGGVAELAVFRNEGHGFDLDPANRDAPPRGAARGRLHDPLVGRGLGAARPCLSCRRFGRQPPAVTDQPAASIGL